MVVYLYEITCLFIYTKLHVIYFYLTFHIRDYNVHILLLLQVWGIVFFDVYNIFDSKGLQ